MSWAPRKRRCRPIGPGSGPGRGMARKRPSGRCRRRHGRAGRPAARRFPPGCHASSSCPGPGERGAAPVGVGIAAAAGMSRRSSVLMAVWACLWQSRGCIRVKSGVIPYTVPGSVLGGFSGQRVGLRRDIRADIRANIRPDIQADIRAKSGRVPGTSSGKSGSNPRLYRVWTISGYGRGGPGAAFHGHTPIARAGRDTLAFSARTPARPPAGYPPSRSG